MGVRRLAIGLLLAFPCLGTDGALYKWVDDKGGVHYSDKPPEKNKDALQLSNRGIVLKKIEGGLTPEEKKARDEEARRKQLEEAKLAETRRRDNALLQSFTNVHEIDMRRDREIEGMEAAIANLRGQEKLVSGRLADDRKRAASFERGNKPLPAAIKQDIARGEADKKTIGEEIARKLDQIADTRKKYDQLKKHYIELTQGPSTLQRPAASGQAAPPKK
jgi:hypothetical protein